MLLAVIESWQRRYSVCQVASPSEHWELHNTSVCHHLFRHICHFSMDVNIEQQANIKFCVKLSKSGAETIEMLRHAYGNEAMCRVMCFEWHVHFKRGRTSLEDEWSSERTSTSSTTTNMETIWWLVHEDRRITIKDIAADGNVSYGMFFAV
jgi:hypothetical protein